MGCFAPPKTLPLDELGPVDALYWIEMYGVLRTSERLFVDELGPVMLSIG